MDIDVVIATSDSIADKDFGLYFTIRSILSQNIQPKTILVVENTNYARTKAALDLEFGKLVSVIDGSRKPKNISFIRNLGVSYSQADLILFMDDDVVIARNNCLETILHQMRNLDFYCGANRYWSQKHWSTQLKREYTMNHIQNILKATSFLPNSIDRQSGNKIYHHRTFIGHFGCVQRQIFEQLNGFDESFTGWGYQDTDFMFRLVNESKTYDIMAFDGLGVFHLNHSVDKSEHLSTNKLRFESRQQSAGVLFSLDSFFGEFLNDKFDIIS